MACRPCNKKRNNKVYDVMGGFKYLPAHQIKARLETFKRIYCKDCDIRYECDFVMYKHCKHRPK